MVRPSVLVVADPHRIAELVAALSERLPSETTLGDVEVLISSGGDDTIDLFAARKPTVAVITASLEAGDSKALIEALRAMAPASELAVVVVGDDHTMRTALDAAELRPDRFVGRPLAPQALRYAVAGGLDAVILVRSARAGAADAGARTARGGELDNEPTDNRAAMRARWEAIADSMVESAVIEEPPSFDEHAFEPSSPFDEAPPLPPITIRPRRHADLVDPPAWQPGTHTRHGYPELRGVVTPIGPAAGPRADEVVAPTREPTLIIRDPLPDVPAESNEPSSDPAPVQRARTTDAPALPRTRTSDDPVLPRTRTSDEPVLPRTRTGEDRVIVTERGQLDDKWSDPKPLAELVERDSQVRIEVPPHDSGMPLDDFEDDLVIGHDLRGAGKLPSHDEVLNDLPNAELPELLDAPPPPSDGRDFARQLRAKMSMMAQRLFSGGEVPAGPAVDVAPRHDHHTEIDLALLGEEGPALGGGVTEIEPRASPRPVEPREHVTAPGSWETQVRERGLPEAGELVRGTSDAAMLLARMFAQNATGRVVFRRDDAEKIVFFDQGRPVFASSNEPLDRMGELLVREGKITASQYERCQTVVAESGRRMGEILVDVGYLKRRELLPAVRRHVEDIVYSLFGWDRGHYQIATEPQPSAERIRLSRHPASLILEGIRRKLDRTTLERLVGPPSTVIEVRDRDRLGTVINLGDLAAEERAALAAFDGQADLTAAARTAGVDPADALPLAWGLVALGLAIARRTDTEAPDESTALVGETDLAIDRERVRARWQLVTDADYFALLGVRRDATTFEIRRSYQSARRDFAADCFPSDLRRELAQELDDIANVLDEAFRVLRDDRLRLTYLANLIE